MDYIKSPLNYVGGKHKLLPQIIPLFPDNIDTFYDLFCGGCNVAINIKANQIVANDLLTPVIDMFQIFLINTKENIFTTILEVIDVYKLSDSTKQTRLDNSNVNKYNKEAYLELRRDYNLSKNKLEKIFLFYTLCCYSFSNQIRFNSKGEFNMPYGERCFNGRMRDNLSLFLDKLHNIKITFTNQDFSEFYFNSFNQNDFVYFDPPYSDTIATYNEKGAWSKKDDENLFNFADRLNDIGVKFAMSNILRTEWLKEWSKKYNVHKLNYNYKNCNYQKKDREGNECEILITNY